MSGEVRDFEPELTQRLGRIVIHWSYIEHLISDLFVWLTEGDQASMTVVTANVSSASLMDWSRTIIDASNDYSDSANEIRSLLTEIGEVRSERNTLVHGLWGFAPEPMSAIVQVIRLERSTLVTDLVVTPADLDELILHICDLATKLRDLLLRLEIKA